MKHLHTAVHVDPAPLCNSSPPSARSARPVAHTYCYKYQCVNNFLIRVSVHPTDVKVYQEPCSVTGAAVSITSPMSRSSAL